MRQATLADGDLSYTADYYPATGQMQSITVTGASGVVHDLDYAYDGYGNLHTQTKVYAGGTSSETFWYDDLHRLTESDRRGPGGSQTINYDYDPAGNLTLKDDYATVYAYTGSRPNAVSSITKVGGGTATFTYDANGNRLAGDGKTLTYTAFNRPATISAGGVTASFAYGADLARYRQDKSTGETILYVDKLMEIVQDGGSTEYRHYLGDVAILTKTGSLTDPYPAIRFLHRDRLGSVVTITDEMGEAEARGYDPFGKPREPDGADKSPPVLGSLITDRGFTDHEHLDASQLIHMNGRVYDYNLGRFLSVDPLIQAPGHSQSLNPYSYIMNNPLARVDPSGYRAYTGTRIDTEERIVDGIGTSGGQPLTVFGHISNDNGAKISPEGGSVANTSTTSIGSQHATGQESSGSGSNVPQRGAGTMSDEEYDEVMGSENFRNYARALHEKGVVTAETAAAILESVNPADPVNLAGGGVIKAAGSTVLVLLKSGRLATKTIEVLEKGIPLDSRAKDALRRQARRIWEKQTGRRAFDSDLDIHHRIPLEYAHLFPEDYPNRLSNLVGVPKDVHAQINNDWSAFRRIERLYQRETTADSVINWANMLDERYASEFQRLE